MTSTAVGLAATLDCETTGLVPGVDEIIELAVVLFSYEMTERRIIQVVDSYCGLREPSCSISSRALQVHGITMKAVKGKYLDAQRLRELLDKAEFIVAHNAAFDGQLVNALFPSATKKKWYCSMNGINWKKEGCATKGLDGLLKAHGITPVKSHRAEADANGVIDLLMRSDKQGKTYLARLLDHGPLKASDMVAEISLELLYRKALEALDSA